MDLLEGELSENIPEGVWAREGRCSSIKNLWLVLLVELALMARRIEMSSEFQGRIALVEDCYTFQEVS